MKQLLIMVMAMAFCTATAEAQTTLQRNDSLYFTREQIKFERVNANGDSIFSVAISPTQINQSISNVQSGLNAATEGRIFLTTGAGAAYGGMVGFAIDPTYGTDNVAVFFQQNAGPMVTAVPQGEEGAAWEIAIFSGDLQDNTSYQFNYHVKTFEPETQPGQ